MAASLHSPFGGPATPPAASGWDRFTADHAVGDILQATVTGHLAVGAFVHISDGVDGVLVGSQPAPGTQLAVRIHQLDLQRRRVSVVPAA